MHFGEKLKELRQQKQLTQPELAQSIGIEQSYLSKLENDKAIPSSETLVQILAVFEISLEQYLADLDATHIRKQLSGLPEVDDYLRRRQLKHLRSRKKWVLGSALSGIIGISLLVGGHFELLFSNEMYEYFSQGVTTEGEPKTLFIDNGIFYGSPEERKKAKEEVGKRKDIDIFLSRSYLGEIHITKVANGWRAYRISREQQVFNTGNRVLLLIGTLLFTASLFGFIVERRLRD